MERIGGGNTSFCLVQEQRVVVNIQILRNRLSFKILKTAVRKEEMLIKLIRTAWPELFRRF